MDSCCTSSNQASTLINHLGSAQASNSLIRYLPISCFHNIDHYHVSFDFKKCVSES